MPYSYYVYILRCADNSYYTGVTNDIEFRIWQHQAGLIKKCYTHTRRPVTCVYAEETNDIGGAIHREKQIKGWSRKKKEALMADDEKLLIKLSERRTPNSPGYRPRQGWADTSHYGSGASP